MTGSRISAVVGLALRYLAERRFATWVSVGAIALGVMLVVAVGNLNFAVKRAAVEGSIRYPLLVGPSGASSVQLVFSTIFHVDKPTGTVPFSVLEKLRKDRRVKAAFPVAVADAVGAYPGVGTDASFLETLSGGVAAGALDLRGAGDAVLGSEAARRLGMKLGQHFHGSHGHVGDEEAEVHEEVDYRVVGILAPTGGPEDAAIYVQYQAVWKAHAGEKGQGAGHDEEEEDHLGQGRLTAVLVQTRSPVYTAQLEREMTQAAGTQGVDTARAMRRMVSYLNRGERAVELFGAATLAVAIVMILVTLVMSLNERRRELALLRSLGVGRGTIASVVMVEALVITAAGAAHGVALGHGLVWWAEHLVRDALGVTVEPLAWTAMEGAAVVACLVAGQVLAVVSLIWTYRMNLVEEVARGG